MTPIADQRAVEAADMYANLNYRPGPYAIKPELENAFKAGWQARSAAGPATREQGSEIDFLREAFFFWSKHKDACPVWESPKATCNCGLQKICDKALAFIDAANKGEK